MTLTLGANARDGAGTEIMEDALAEQAKRVRDYGGNNVMVSSVTVSTRGRPLGNTRRGPS